ncbi:hypothetical protein C8Q73DRAFT_30628 [Cubamyces lactineus]|nr:hypothetical protein C8Q73DRAFT_30628 [Cubamyces lactineus]
MPRARYTWLTHHPHVRTCLPRSAEISAREQTSQSGRPRPTPTCTYIRSIPDPGEDESHKMDLHDEDEDSDGRGRVYSRSRRAVDIRLGGPHPPSRSTPADFSRRGTDGTYAFSVQDLLCDDLDLRSSPGQSTRYRTSFASANANFQPCLQSAGGRIRSVLLGWPRRSRSQDGTVPSLSGTDSVAVGRCSKPSSMNLSHTFAANNTHSGHTNYSETTYIARPFFLTPHYPRTARTQFPPSPTSPFRHIREPDRTPDFCRAYCRDPDRPGTEAAITTTITISIARTRAVVPPCVRDRVSRYAMLCTHTHDSLPLGPQGKIAVWGSRLITMNGPPLGEACEACALLRSLMPHEV